MVDFGGWDMPVQYKDLTIAQSTVHTRQGASIFDVSHMGQLRFHGADREEFVQSLIVGSVKALKRNQTRYSLITNDQGGVIDDTVVTRREDHMYVVVNAGRVDVDLPYFRQKIAESGKDVSMEVIEDRSLIAFQGPQAAAVLQRHTPYDLSTLEFFYVADAAVEGIECQVSRSGYTGEDGFEVSVPTSSVVDFCNILLSNSEAKLAGLGARDALRLEAGLSLYGHDLDETTTPVEADLLWTMSKKRREQGGFPGHAVIAKQLAEGVTRKRAGFVGEKIPVRDHSKLVGDNGEDIGEVCSGSYSPCLQKPIGMAYIKPEYCVPGKVITAIVRNKKVPVTVTKMPFVKKGYFKL